MKIANDSRDLPCVWTEESSRFTSNRRVAQGQRGVSQDRPLLPIAVE
jgi:hypothetical protein